MLKMGLWGIAAYEEAAESRIFQSILASQLNDNPTLFKDQLTRIKVGILYMKANSILPQLMIVC